MPEPSSPTPPGQPEPVDLASALKRDEKEDLRRRLGETTEQLEAAHAKDCPSCGAEFTKGVGAVGKKKTAEKAAEKPTEKKPAKPAKEEKDATTETTSQGAGAEEGDGGFGFFD